MAAAPDMLGRALGESAFQHFFSLLLADNGTEFGDLASIEKSVLPGKKSRTEVYYCDVRAPQRKAGCEKNHVELRRTLPKGRGISFDDLVGADMCPMQMLLAAHPESGRALLDALGVEIVAYELLELSVKAINSARRMRGEDDLI